MSLKYKSASDLELEISFDASLGYERLKEIVDNDEIERIKHINSFNDLDLKIKRDFVRMLEPIVEKHNNGIEKDSKDHIDNLFKKLESIIYYTAGSSISLHSDRIQIDHYANGEGYHPGAILSEVESYDLKNESDSFKAFMADLDKLLNEYGFKLEYCNIEYIYMSESIDAMF